MSAYEPFFDMAGSTQRWVWRKKVREGLVTFPYNGRFFGFERIETQATKYTGHIGNTLLSDKGRDNKKVNFSAVFAGQDVGVKEQDDGGEEW